MAPPANTSGLSLLMNRQLGLVAHALVKLGALVLTISSFVGQNYFCETGITRYSGKVFSGQMVTPYGMDRGVVSLAPAAPSTHHHGST